MMQKLTVADIKDHRAYEAERDAFRAEVIALKKRRRIAVGEFITFVFENATTMRFQIQEMARAERMLTDVQIAHEVETYNELIPDAGELCASMFLELTTEAQLREWLPKLRGVHEAVSFWLPNGERVVGVEPDAERLTREEETTTTVHYMKFHFTPAQAAQLREPGTRLVIDHPDYQAIAELNDEQRAELAADLASV
ncbi:MAG: DUF3501 family protein [Acidimicrobiia bacterium]